MGVEVAAYRWTDSANQLACQAWSKFGGHLALSLYSSNEPTLSELSQWPCHDDVTVNIFIGIDVLKLDSVVSMSVTGMITSIGDVCCRL